jgi:hypothetical protein
MTSGDDALSTVRMRARCLAAMGLSATASLVLACSSSRAHPDDPNGGGIPDDVEVTRDELPEGAWAIETVAEPGRRTRRQLPTCPRGSFCVVGPQEGAVGNAPAPFTTCAQSVPYPRTPAPADATEGDAEAYDPSSEYSIDFNPHWTSHERTAKHADACCYNWTEPCPGGRPLRDAGGEPLLASIAHERSDWSRDPAAHVRDPERAGHWARAAQYEHASVASFAQFSLQLLALGAPADLIARSHRAALDEILHARLAFTMAFAFGHDGIAPGPLPMPASAHEITAVDVLRSTVRDGCVAETRAALQARRDLADAKSTLERDTLARIADDEERHAELAFATVAWLVDHFGAEVCEALADELDRLATDPCPDVSAVVLPCLHALAART